MSSQNEALLEIILHLRAVVIQSGPSDDQINLDHVRAALEIARKARTPQEPNVDRMSDEFWESEVARLEKGGYDE